MSDKFMISVKRIGPDDPAMPLPTRKTAGASCVDLNLDLRQGVEVLGTGELHRNLQAFRLDPNVRVKISVGYAFEIPRGWAGVLRIRSGAARDAGLQILGGEIDSDYRGPVEAIILNTGAAPFTIEHGARVVQMRIQPVWMGALEVVPELSATARGAGGFGSTNAEKSSAYDRCTCATPDTRGWRNVCYHCDRPILGSGDVAAKNISSEVKASRASAWLQTFSGIAATPFALDPQMISVTDLAHALAIKSRYNGHCRVPYSVAQHSWILSYCVPEEDAWEALHHDDDEIYGGDAPGPLVKWLPDVQALRATIRRSLCAKFGLAEKLPESVRDADMRILLNEREVLFGPAPQPWIPDIKGMKPLDLSKVPQDELGAFGRIWPWSWGEAESMWLKRFVELATRVGWRAP